MRNFYKLFILVLIWLGLANLNDGMSFTTLGHAAERIKIETTQSHVSFVGDSEFITGRFKLPPRSSGVYWSERITFTGGVMFYHELNPGMFYTGMNAGKHVFRDSFNKNSFFKKKGLSITEEDIKEVDNKSGEYYMVAAEGTSINCSMAKQFSGDSNAMTSVGNQVATLFFCRSKSWGDIEKMTEHVKDIMDRARYDEGELNKQRRASN